MADELKVSMSAAFFDGDEEVAGPGAFANQGVDVAGEAYVRKSQEIGTDWEDLDLGDVSGGGHLMIANMDGANYVQLRAAADETPFARLLPQRKPPAFFTIDSGATISAKADTASCRVDYLLTSL